MHISTNSVSSTQHVLLCQGTSISNPSGSLDQAQIAGDLSPRISATNVKVRGILLFTIAVIPNCRIISIHN